MNDKRHAHRVLAAALAGLLGHAGCGQDSSSPAGPPGGSSSGPGSSAGGSGGSSSGGMGSSSGAASSSSTGASSSSGSGGSSSSGTSSSGTTAQDAGDDGSSGGTSDATTTAACTGTAHYQLDLDATWSAQTHPNAFPPDAHFSPLIGGVHDSSYVVWTLGGYASPGVKDMAENGGTDILRGEVQAAIQAGTASLVIEGQGISPPPGTDSVAFDVDPAHSLVSVGAMLAPTPDWFTGLDSTNLCGPAGWIQELTLDALVYDAGTKTGDQFSYDGSPEHVPIKLFDWGVFAGNTKVGTFHFVRTP